MADDITIPDSALKYILLQRTEYLALPKKKFLYKALGKVARRPSFDLAVGLESRFRKGQVKADYSRDMGGEYEEIRHWLPESPTAILDIGCGIGGIDVLLHKHYNNPALTFYLLDKTDTTENIFYGFEQQGAFYNSLALTRAVLTGNGIPDGNIHTMEATEDNRIDVPEQLDLVISLISWGFHYPVSTYLERVHQILKPGGRLILDVRKDTEGRDEVAHQFGNAEVVAEGKKKLRLCATRSQGG